MTHKQLKKIHLKIAYISFILLNMFACGIKKKSIVPENGISILNYPYIEKFHEGLRLKSKGEIDNAISAFNYCLNVRQNDDAVYYALSELYLQKKEVDKSFQAIQNASKIDPNNIWYTQELTYLLFDQKKFDEALRGFEKLVKREPANVNWLYGLAECYVKVGKIDDAIKALEKTEDQVGKHPELTIQKFELYVRNRQPEKGLEEINKARLEFPKDPQLIGALVDYYFQTKQDQKAIGLLKELTKSDPSNGRAHLVLADIYRQQHNKKEYYEELKKAFICDDVDIDTKMKVLISIHEDVSKLPQEAYDLVHLMVQQYPSDSKAYSIQGDFLLRAEKEDKALISYKKALQFDKSKYTIWNQVLIMEYQAGHFNDLFIDSKECLEVFPSIPSVYLLNGVGANQLKKHQDAVTVLEAGKELVINDKSLLSEFYSQLGEAYFGLKKYSEGKLNYESALKIDPNSTLNMNNYAYRLALAKIDLGHAEELIIRANVISPNQAHFIDTYGWILFQKGEFSKAKESFDKALELSPSDKVIVEHVGDAYFKTGQIEKAVEFWLKAKTLGSTNKNLDRKIEKKEYYEPLY